MKGIVCKTKREGKKVLSFFSSSHTWNTGKVIEPEKDIESIWPKGGDLVIVEINQQEVSFMNSINFSGHFVPYIKFISQNPSF